MNVIRNNKNPFAVHLCSYKGAIKEIMDPMGCPKWIIYTHEEDIGELPDLPKKLIYLSPDAENTLEDFDATTSFAIGGIVDKMVCSCTSLYKANLCSIKSAKLPLNESMLKV